MHQKEACPVMSVLLGFTVLCLSLLVHSLVHLGFMQMKLNLSVVLNVIEVSCLVYCCFICPDFTLVNNAFGRYVIVSS